MKKILLSVAVLALTMTASAQYFVGGSVDLNTTGGNTKVDGVKADHDKTFGFNINPKVGYFLSDKVAVGIGAGFGMSKDTDKTTTPGSDIVATATEWNVAPFMRYYAMEFGAFSVFAEAQLGVGGYNTKVKTNGVEVKGTPAMTYGLIVTPGVSYKLSKCIDLEANLNFMNLGYTGTYSNDKDSKTKTSTSNFGFGFDSSNVTDFGSDRALTIGAIFKF